MNNLFRFILLLVTATLSAQQGSEEILATLLSKSDITVYEADQLPEYPGGINSFRREIMSKFNIERIKTEGIINSEVSFVVNETGKMTDIKCLGNADMCRELSRTVLRIKTQWKPALKQGVAVPYRFSVPLTMSVH